jgi:hypothetical protein
MAEPGEAVANQNHWGNLAQAGGVVAGASVMFLGMEATSSWYFGHGFCEGLGFPAQLVSLRTSTDIFSSFAMEYSVAFSAGLWFGFLISPQKETTLKRHLVRTYASVGVLFALCLIGAIWDPESAFYHLMLTILALFSPLLIGYTYNSHRNSGKLRGRLVFSVAFSVFCVYTLNMYEFGKETARNLIKQGVPLYPLAEKGPAAVKESDYPLLTIRAKEKLILNSQPKEDGPSYEYKSTEADFLRLVFQDDANYYIIESYGGKASPHAIRKDLVEEMLFQQSPSSVPVSGNTP